MIHSSTLRRIALVANYPWKLTESSVRYEVFVEGLSLIGVDVVTICREGSQEGYIPRVVVVDSDEVLHDRKFWSNLGCDAAIVWSWFGHAPLMRAIKSAGVKVLALGDSDGCVSPIYHPMSGFITSFPHHAPTPREALRGVYWQLRSALKQSREIHLRLAHTVASPNVFTLPSTGAIAEFDRIMMRSGQPSIAGTLRWLPYPVPDKFFENRILSRRAHQMIAVGRWDAWQKNAPLLERSIRRVLAAGRSNLRFVIVGRGGERVFDSLMRDYPSYVQVLGSQSRDLIAEEMAMSRALISSSRWEGSPSVANEMLASGGTIVGTPIPSLRGIVEGDRFGRVCSRHTPRSLAKAIIDEAAVWDAGRRYPEQIAAHWRPLVSSEGVARQILKLLSV